MPSAPAKRFANPSDAEQVSQESILQPKKLIEAWVDAFNRADADHISEYYSDDAVNHQVANYRIQGKAAIRQKFIEEFAAAKMICQIENLYSDGDWAILEWSDPSGLRGCGFFQIRNDKIQQQRGYWDKLSFLRLNGLPLPVEGLESTRSGAI